MEYSICINKKSFPAPSIEEGKVLFDNALQGVLALQGDCPSRFLFYLDSDSGSLSDFVIADGLTYKDFLTSHIDRDLEAFLYEVEDKSPALDSLSEEQVEEMTAYRFYVDQLELSKDDDVFALSWVVSGILLSIDTGVPWNQPCVQISRSNEDGQYVADRFELRNISDINHGRNHSSFFHSDDNFDLADLMRDHFVVDPVQRWFDSLSKQNKIRIVDKLRMVCERCFSGAEPLFKPLKNTDGYKEIRFSAYDGGTIRIIFKHVAESQYVLLAGFIKKSNNDGYDSALASAKREFSDLVNQ